MKNSDLDKARLPTNLVPSRAFGVGTETFKGKTTSQKGLTITFSSPTVSRTFPTIVGTTFIVVSNADETRKSLLMQNRSANAIVISFNNPPSSINDGILIASGSYFSASAEGCPTDTVYALSDTAGSLLVTVEGKQRL